MWSRPRIVLGVVLALAAAGSFVAVSSLRAPAQRSAAAHGTSPSPAARRLDGAKSLPSVADVRFDGFDGAAPITIASLRGKPIVVNYWASWCSFCLAEMPAFEKVRASIAPSVSFLGVDIKDDTTEAKRLAEQTGVTYPLASDPSGAIFRRLGAFAMPTTFFIDDEGRLVERFSGPLDAEQLRARIRKNFGI